MDMIPVVGGLVPTQAEVGALEALLDHEAEVGGLVGVAVEIARIYLELGEEIPGAVAAELTAVRRVGGVSAVARRADVRVQRRRARAEFRTLVHISARPVVKPAASDLDRCAA